MLRCAFVIGVDAQRLDAHEAKRRRIAKTRQATNNPRSAVLHVATTTTVLIGEVSSIAVAALMTVCVLVELDVVLV